MKKILLGIGLAVACSATSAKDKMIPLSVEDAAALQGKTAALTVHERPSFSAMTAGKAGFGLFGVAAMISAGNKLVDENHVADPAVIVRTQLASALRDAYSLQVLPPDTVPTKANKPKELAAVHPEADYVLDVRSGGWMYAYYPTRWGSYWVGYSVQVQLVDTKTGKQVSNVACNSSTHENPNSPSREQLVADEAKLLKDVTASLGWMCVQILAKEQFRLAPEQVASIPAEYADPLARLSPTPANTAESEGAGEVRQETASAGDKLDDDASGAGARAGGVHAGIDAMRTPASKETAQDAGPASSPMPENAADQGNDE